MSSRVKLIVDGTEIPFLAGDQVDLGTDGLLAFYGGAEAEALRILTRYDHATFTKDSQLVGAFHSRGEAEFHAKASWVDFAAVADALEAGEKLRESLNGISNYSLSNTKNNAVLNAIAAYDAAKKHPGTSPAEEA